MKNINLINKLKVRRKFFLINYFCLMIKKYFKVKFKIEKNQCMKIDVVIPTISKDFDVLKLSIESLKFLNHEINKIFVVSQNNDYIKEFCDNNSCIFIDEDTVLGYKKDEINYVVNGKNRSGWIYQQLLKLSADKFVKMENYFVLDSDTVFINKNSFFENGKYVFLESKEWHQRYFDAFEEIFSYKTKNTLSFISHMMIFNVNLLNEMKNEISKKWGKKWDDVYLMSIRDDEISCISEYETYANWVLIHYPNMVIKKPFYNLSLSRKYLDNICILEKKYSKNYKSLSFHTYLK